MRKVEFLSLQFPHLWKISILCWARSITSPSSPNFFFYIFFLILRNWGKIPIKMRKSLSVQQRNHRASSLCIIGKYHWGFKKGREKISSLLRQFFPLPFHFDSACHTCQRVPHNGSKRKKWDKKHFLTFISAAVYSQHFNLKNPPQANFSLTQIECRKNLHIQLNWKLLFVQNYLLWNESFVIVIFHSFHVHFFRSRSCTFRDSLKSTMLRGIASYAEYLRRVKIP